MVRQTVNKSSCDKPAMSWMYVGSMEESIELCVLHAVLLLWCLQASEQLLCCCSEASRLQLILYPLLIGICLPVKAGSHSLFKQRRMKL